MRDGPSLMFDAVGTLAYQESEVQVNSHSRHCMSRWGHPPTRTTCTVKDKAWKHNPATSILASPNVQQERHMQQPNPDPSGLTFLFFCSGIN